MNSCKLNCFEITNAASLRMKYRTVDVKGPFDAALADGDLAERNLQQLVKRIQFEEKTPVAIARGGAEPLLAIPADHKLRRIEYELTLDVATLTPRDETAEITLANGGDHDRIAIALLNWYLRAPLFRDDRLWSTGSSTYFNKRPLNYLRDDRDIDIYRGFGFRIGRVGGRLGLWVRLVHRYTEARWLLDTYDSSAIHQELKMRHLLYHYGHKWFPVQLLGLTGKSIEDHCFVPDGATSAVSVYDYTMSAVGRKNQPAWIESLDPRSEAIAFRYPNNEKKRVGAAGLCKLMVQTEDPRVRSVHTLSILEPAVRMKETQRMLQSHLQGASFGDVPICIRTTPLEVEPRTFRIPTQEFGQGKQLRVGRNTAAGEVSVRDFARKRMDYLLDPEGGFAVHSSLDAQYLIVPLSQERKVVEDFQNRLEKTVCSLIKRGYGFTTVVYDDTNARTLKQQVDAINEALLRAEVISGRGVLMLPARAQPDLHNHLKRRLGERLNFQCVDARKVREFYEVSPHNGRANFIVKGPVQSRYVSYLRYTAMGLLLVNRQWPWILPDGTHYDMYVAIDVLHNTAAFTFFGQGGKQCIVRSVRSEQSEKLLRKQVRAVVYETLRTDLKNGGAVPRSIVARRDGRAFQSEWRGFKDAIEQLTTDGLLPVDVKYGMIEVHKRTAEGMRLVEEDRTSFLNPRIGSWTPINSNEGLICTTGLPFSLRGTADPLLVRVSAGNLDLGKVLEDTFAMSLLCWPKPDGFIRLSIDLKLCDDNLRAVASLADDDEAEFGEDDPEEAEERQAVGWNG